MDLHPGLGHIVRHVDDLGMDLHGFGDCRNGIADYADRSISDRRRILFRAWIAQTSCVDHQSSSVRAAAERLAKQSRDSMASQSASGREFGGEWKLYVFFQRETRLGEMDCWNRFYIGEYFYFVAKE